MKHKNTFSRCAMHLAMVLSMVAAIATPAMASDTSTWSGWASSLWQRATEYMGSYLPTTESIADVGLSIGQTVSRGASSLAEVVKEHPWWATAGALAVGTAGYYGSKWWRSSQPVAPSTPNPTQEPTSVPTPVQTPNRITPATLGSGGLDVVDGQEPIGLPDSEPVQTILVPTSEPTQEQTPVLTQEPTTPTTLGSGGLGVVDGQEPTGLPDSESMTPISGPTQEPTTPTNSGSGGPVFNGQATTELPFLESVQTTPVSDSSRLPSAKEPGVIQVPEGMKISDYEELNATSEEAAEWKQAQKQTAKQLSDWEQVRSQPVTQKAVKKPQSLITRSDTATLPDTQTQVSTVSYEAPVPPTNYALVPLERFIEWFSNSPTSTNVTNEQLQNGMLQVMKDEYNLSEDESAEPLLQNMLQSISAAQEQTNERLDVKQFLQNEERLAQSMQQSVLQSQSLAQAMQQSSMLGTSQSWYHISSDAETTTSSSTSTIVNEDAFRAFVQSLFAQQLIDNTQYITKDVNAIISAVRRGGELAYNLFFETDESKALSALQGFSKKDHNARLDDLVSLTWFFYAQAFNKNEQFTQGTFVIEDPYGRLADLLMAYVKKENNDLNGTAAEINFSARGYGISSNSYAYRRTSSHIPYSSGQGEVDGQDYRHYGIDARYRGDNENTPQAVSFVLPAHKSHILFGKIGPFAGIASEGTGDRMRINFRGESRYPDIFFKIEDYGLSSQEVAHHGWEYLYSVKRKVFGGDDGPSYRKERVEQEFLRGYKAIGSDLGKNDRPRFYGYEQLVKSRGLSGLKYVIEAVYHNQGYIAEALKALLSKYAAKYDHIERRMGREVILTQGDMIDAIYYAHLNEENFDAEKILPILNDLVVVRQLYRAIQQDGFDQYRVAEYDQAIKKLQEMLGSLPAGCAIPKGSTVTIETEVQKLLSQLQSLSEKKEAYEKANDDWTFVYNATQPLPLIVKGSWSQEAKSQIATFTPDTTDTSIPEVNTNAATVLAFDFDGSLDEALKSFAQRYALILEDNQAKAGIVTFRSGVFYKDTIDSILGHKQGSRNFFIVRGNGAGKLHDFIQGRTFYANLACNVICLFPEFNEGQTSFPNAENICVGWYNIGGTFTHNNRLAADGPQQATHVNIRLSINGRVVDQQESSIERLVLDHFPYIAENIQKFMKYEGFRSLGMVNFDVDIRHKESLSHNAPINVIVAVDGVLSQDALAEITELNNTAIEQFKSRYNAAEQTQGFVAAASRLFNWGDGQSINFGGVDLVLPAKSGQ